MANARFSLLALIAILHSAFASPARSQDASPSAAREMSEQAAAFLDALSEQNRSRATLPFADRERFAWDFWPGAHPGIKLEALERKSKEAAIGLIRAGLSERGYTKTRIIKELDRFNPWTSPGPFLMIFGDPKNGEDAWGWRLQGHHLSLNFTIAKNEVVGTPSFFGTQPLSHKSVRGGKEPLEIERALAIELFLSLENDKKSKARIDRPSINYLPERIKEAKRPELSGIPASQLNAQQATLLDALISEYIGNLTTQIADEFQRRIDAEGDAEIVFGFAGSPEKGQSHYYRIQSSYFIIEYDNRDGGDHIHCVWRTFDGDFGEDLLRLHYAQHEH